jgi:aspartyl-tRNA(Asn)/glutamyl-tRNA(Gln) amidotransferase subunit C
MKITREDVLRVAELAHLDLTETEIEMYLRQLDSILTYVEKLNELDTTGVEPMAQVVPQGAQGLAGTPLREDAEAPCNIAKEVLPGAPEAAPAHFRVPRVIER